MTQPTQNDSWLSLIASLLASGAAAAFYLAVLLCLIAASV